MVSFLNSHASSLPRMHLSRWEDVRASLPSLLHHVIRHIMRDPLLFIWQFLTAPLWLGSGIPLPGYPTIRTTASTIDTHLNASFDGAAGPAHYLDEQIRSLSRRFWLAGMCAAAFRGFTIGTIICTIWAIGGVRNITSDPYLSGLLALMMTGALLGAAFGFVTRPSAMRIATMLDRTFHLDERLTTAFDPTLMAGPVIPNSMRRLQLADAANGFAEIHGDVRGAAVLPVREAVIAVLAAICLVTALLFSIAGDQIPATTNAVVPAFVPSSERFVRQQQELEAQQQAKQRAALAQSPKPSQDADEQGKATKDLSTVGTALKDQPLTKSASHSITSGDYSGASKSLHDNAAAAKNLPQDQRNALAGKLEEAASAISPGNKDLASASKQAAADLRAGGDQATQGLNSLADQIDKTGKKATPNQEAGAAQPNSSASESNSSPNQQSQSQSNQQDQQSQAQQSQASKQSGSTQSQQPASSNTNDPGSGMAAQPGIGSEPQQNPAGQSASQQKSGSAAGSGQSSQPQAGSGGSPGSQQSGQQAGTGTGQSSTSASNRSGQSAQSKGSDANGKPGSSSNPASGANSSQQPGTGGGGGQTNGTNQSAAGQNKPGSGASTSQPAGKSDTAGNGKAGNPPPGNNTTGSNTGNPPSAQSGDQTLVLQGTSNDNSVGTGNDIGSSSSGSGSGSGVASGNATQGKVGPAGPDSNHVPDAYRDIVKGYFNGDGTTP